MALLEFAATYVICQLVNPWPAGRSWWTGQPIGQQVAVGGQVNAFVANAQDRPIHHLRP